MEKINYSDLGAWILERLEPFRKSKALLDQYCFAAKDDFALLDSCLHLGNLSEDKIEAVGKAQIPPSCWYAMVVLADEGDAVFASGLRVAEEHRLTRQPVGMPLVVKLRALLTAGTKQALVPSDLRAAAVIARKYSALSADNAKVFENMAAFLRKSGKLTPKQIGFIGSLLSQMRSARVTGGTPDEVEVLGRLYSMID
jgi:hypothetical protein